MTPSTPHDMGATPGHPIHPKLAAVPVGLWLFSLAVDIWLRIVGGPGWLSVAAFGAMAVGLIVALISVVPASIEVLSLRSGVRGIAMIHMALNIAIILLYVVNLRVRATGQDAMLELALSLIAAGALGVSGLLGSRNMPSRAPDLQRRSDPH